MEKAGPSPQQYEYYGEIMPSGIGGAPIDVAACAARLNELGAQGWQLVCFTSTIAWFARSL